MAKRKRVHPVVAATTMVPLLLGMAPKVFQQPKPPAPSPKEAIHFTAKAQACAISLDACPANGCEPQDSPHALVNQLKRNIPTSASVKTLTWDDFTALQEDADSTVGEDQELDASDRARLRNIRVSSGNVSEGDLVQLSGFLVDNPHANTGESVNCDLKGVANNDFHIPFANDPDSTAFEGIVVEMIPQNRPAEWNLKNLRRVEDERRQVVVVGQLFYDNLHRIRTDPDAPADGQPARFSLFEIHPITQFLVCKSTTKCDPSSSGDWETLKDFTAEAPTARR